MLRLHSRLKQVFYNVLQEGKNFVFFEKKVQCSPGPMVKWLSMAFFDAWYSLRYSFSMSKRVC